MTRPTAELPPRNPGETALRLIGEDHVGAAGELVPTAEEVVVLENLPGQRARVRTRSGEEVLRWYDDLYPDAASFPDDVQLVVAGDCGDGEAILALAALEGGIGLREALSHVGAEKILELHETCPSRSLLSPDEVAWLKGRAGRF